MANIKQMVVQQNQAIMLTEANDYFKYLSAGLQKDKGVSITVDQSYVSSYDINNELRNFVKNKTTAPADIQALLDSNKTIADIVKENNYDKLKTYLDNLTSADFEPPLKQDFTSAEGIIVKQFPNHSSVDPRRTGRLIKPGPIDILKSTEVLKWMINNSVLYGYVLYSDNGLYYIGSDAIKKKLKNAADKQGELKKIVGRFLKNSNALSLLTTTAEKVLDSRLPDANSFADPGNLETIPTHQLKDDNGKIPELIVIDDKPYHLTGFQFNKTITTQEYLYNGWIAKEAGFNLAAKPGASNHGKGIALDINTGSRPKKSLNSKVYSWLVKNSYKFGFVRGVAKEEWHFDYKPDIAVKGPYAAVEGTDSNRFYTDLGLAQGQFQT